jgi:hypothetical protein
MLPYRNFLQCSLFYESLRESHRSAVTNNHTLTTIGDIIFFFKQKGIIDTMNKEYILETDTTKVFTEPINLNEKFWKTGNNYFYNCILAGFRKGTVCYKDANKYISSDKSGHMLFSSDYYNSLDKMSDKEITFFLRDNPIGIDRKVIVHGIHRVCAMIGRLVNNEKYIPFYLGTGY